MGVCGGRGHRKGWWENDRGLCIPSPQVESLFYTQHGATDVCSAGERVVRTALMGIIGYCGFAMMAGNSARLGVRNHGTEFRLIH